MSEGSTSPLSNLSKTPSPPPSPSSLNDGSAARTASEPTANKIKISLIILKSPGRAVKRPAEAKQAERPAKRRKANGSEDMAQASEEEQNIPHQQEQEDPYAHLRPPFEEFWSEEANPILPAVQEQPEHEGGELYFAYGKDMDETYLFRLFSSSTLPEPPFVAIAKLSNYSWVIEPKNRFPIIVPSQTEQNHVYGIVYRLSRPALDMMKAKAEKRGLRLEKKEVQLFGKEEGSMPGFWNDPLVSSDSVTVTVMVGTLDGEEGRLGGSKRKKVMGGLLWGASLGLPESWKTEIRGKLGTAKGPEDTGYWGGEDDEEENEGGNTGGRSSARLRGKEKINYRVHFGEVG